MLATSTQNENMGHFIELLRQNGHQNSTIALKNPNLFHVQTTFHSINLKNKFSCHLNASYELARIQTNTCMKLSLQKTLYKVVEDFPIPKWHEYYVLLLHPYWLFEIMVVRWCNNLTIHKNHQFVHLWHFQQTIIILNDWTMTMITQYNVSTSFLLQLLLYHYYLATLAWTNNTQQSNFSWFAFVSLIDWYIITQFIISTMIYWMLCTKNYMSLFLSCWHIILWNSLT